jgi:predicted MPP superfamily phosphohydrolase
MIKTYLVYVIQLGSTFWLNPCYLILVYFMFRFIYDRAFFHTSDWHLGQFFYNHSRHYEHEQFLAWLLEQIKAKQPHALLIAGDIFDVINPAHRHKNNSINSLPMPMNLPHRCKL